MWGNGGSSCIFTLPDLQNCLGQGPVASKFPQTFSLGAQNYQHISLFHWIECPFICLIYQFNSIITDIQYENRKPCQILAEFKEGETDLTVLQQLHYKKWRKRKQLKTTYSTETLKKIQTEHVKSKRNTQGIAWLQKKKKNICMTLSLKYFSFIICKNGYFIWGKWLEDGWIFYMMSKPGVFPSKRELTAIYWYFFHKLHLIITSNRYSSRLHCLFPSHT